MIWNPTAIDYSKGVTLHKDGTVRANKIGCWVKELHELKPWWKKNGEN